MIVRILLSNRHADDEKWKFVSFIKVYEQISCLQLLYQDLKMLHVLHNVPVLALILQDIYI